MKPYHKRIRIVLDVPKETAGYNKLMQQWENEGGAITVKQSTNLIPEAQLPFRAGEAFQVINGVIDFVEDEAYYIVDLQKVDIE
jgi:hypothetical protein